MIELTKIPQWLRDAIPQDGATHSVRCETDHETSSVRGWVDEVEVFPPPIRTMQDERQAIIEWANKQIFGLPRPPK